MCAGSRFHCTIFSEKPAFQAFPIIPIFYPNFYLKSSNFLLTQAFKRALLFPTFWICSYFSLLFHENALLSILFHYKMSCMCKNPEIFPCLLRLYMLINLFFQGARCKASQNFYFYLQMSLCLAWTIVTAIILLI